FSNKKFYQKLLVLLGGIFANLLFAYVAFTVIFMLGAPGSILLYRHTAIPVVEQVIEKSRAAEYGIVTGDRIIQANTLVIENSISPLLTLLEQKVDHFDLVVDHAGEQKTITIPLDPAHSSTSIYETLGITFKTAAQKGMSLGTALLAGLQETHRWIKTTFHGFAHIFRTQQVKELAGPVMIIAMTIKGAAEGFSIFLLFLAIISINLAVLNLLPLPILDGGQLLFYSIEALMGRQIPHKIREYVHIATWIIFIALFLYLTGQDILRIISKYW
ncbi:MAG TPA: M50 family metallopeptidase, partial [Candidatus Bathyarchaeia archaeon]|nr:M50 family metallopeptidase [Candidatus Bathyarchaeia archaeon]